MKEDDVEGMAALESTVDAAYLALLDAEECSGLHDDGNQHGEDV